MINVVLRQTLIAAMAFGVLSACDNSATKNVSEPLPVHAEDKGFRVVAAQQKTGIVACSTQTFADAARVRLDWHALPDQPGTYHVYRAKDLANDWTRITSSPVADLTLLDTTVVNGSGYRYRVELLPSAGGAAVDLCGDELNAFVAFNTASPHSCIIAANRTAGTVKLDWKMPTAMRARILHRYDSVTPRDGFIQLTETSVASLKDSYVHQKPIYGARNYYQIVSVRDFTNPYTGSIVSIAGNKCESNFQIDSALKIELDNTYLISEAMWRLTKAPGPITKVSGTIINAAGPVLLKFSSYNPATTPQVIEHRVEGSRFYIELPHLYDTWHWNLEAADTEAVLNQTRRYLQVRNMELTPVTLADPTHGWSMRQYADNLTLNNIVSNTPLADYNVATFYAPQHDNNIWRYTSWLKVDEAGEHCFAMDNAGLAQLWLQNVKIIEAATAVQPFARNAACAQLTPGYYAIDLRHRVNMAPRHLRVYWRAPGRVWEPLSEQHIWVNKRENFADADNDNYADDIDRFPNNVFEMADSDVDGIGDRADVDRDGDGVENVRDAYPSDFHRLPDEALQPLQVQWQSASKSLELTWPTLQAGESLQLMRTDLDGRNATLVYQAEAGNAGYTFTGVNNDTTFRLTTVKRDATGLEQPLSYEPIAHWIAWNDSSLQSCSAQRLSNAIDVEWVPAQQSAQLRREQQNAATIELGVQNQSPYQDRAVRHGGVYRYALTTSKRMTNPITQQTVDLADTTPCQTPAVTMQSSLSVALNNLTQIDETHYQKKPTYVGDQTVTGRVQQALGPVSVVAQSGAVSVNTAVDAQGQFSVVLPVDATHTEWNLRVTEDEALTPFSQTIVLSFVLDTMPPVIVLSNNLPTLTYQDVVTLTGQVRDDLSPIRSATIRNGAAQFALTLDANGQFSADIPLMDGSNTIDVVAIDEGGFVSTQSYTIERDSRLPQLQLLAPTDTDTYNDTVSLQYRVIWRHAVNALTATVNGQTAEVINSNGSIYLNANNRSLNEGVNTFETIVRSPVGETKSTLTVTRRVDNTAPVIVIDPLTSPVTQNDSIVITGRVTDDRSGVQRAWLTHDRIAGSFGIVLDADGRFSSTQPLEVGDNRLQVHAVDGRNNEGSASIVVTRDTDRPLMSLVSPIEGLITDQTHVSVEANITHAGQLSELTFTVNGQAGTINATSTPKLYRAVVNGIALQQGSNTLLARLRFARGELEDARHVTLDPEKANENDVAPAIELRSPLSGAVLTERNNTLELALSASARPLTLKLNQQHVPDSAFRWLDSSHARVSVPFAFAENSNSFDAQFVLTDNKNRSTQLSAHYSRDGQAPTIHIDRLLNEPALNEVVENPFMFSGRVQDERLTSVTINEQPVTVEPTTTPGEHRFQIPVSLTPNLEQVIVVTAKDAAGNNASSSYRLLASAAAGLKILLPVANAEFVAESAPFMLDVTTQVEGDAQSTQLFARVDDGEWQTLNRDGRIAQANIASPINDGVHTVIVELRQNNDARVLAREQRQFIIKNLQAIPVEVVKVQPANGALNVEPNEFIAVHFNKTIDTSKLQINVRETAHGLTYQNLDPSGTDFVHAKGAQLVEISRSNTAVPGRVAVLPGQKSIAFYPTNDVAYNGEVFIDVVYDNQTLTRFTYQTRALPTLLGGTVVDALGQPIEGIEVQLADTDRHAITDRDGVYSFGFGEKAENALRGGRYRLRVNPNQKNNRYGTVERWVNLQDGRLQQESTVNLPQLNDSVPYRLISGGKDNLMLAEGELQLNLAQASLLFPDGSRSGGVHAQLLQFHELGKPYTPHAVPLWVYNLQPVGIEVNGPFSVRINMPQLNGSHDYLLIKKFYALIVGSTDDGTALVPVAVGLVENNQLTSVGAIHTKRLDQFGIAMLPFSLQTHFEAYVNSEISWDELQAIITSEMNKAAPARP